MTDSAHPRARIVLDASVAIPLVREEAHSDWARAAIARWHVDQVELTVPRLFWWEIVNGLTRRPLDSGEVMEAIFQLDQLGLQTLDPDRPMLLLTVDLVQRHRLTAYDALYLALAEVLDARLATADRELGAAAGARAILAGEPLRGRRAHETPAAYREPPTWPRWSGAAKYLAELRAAALEAAE